MTFIGFITLLKQTSPFFVFQTHHDDGNDQGGQTNQVELLREEFNQFDMTALGKVRGDAAREQFIFYFTFSHFKCGVICGIWLKVLK